MTLAREVKEIIGELRTYTDDCLSVRYEAVEEDLDEVIFTTEIWTEHMTEVMAERDYEFVFCRAEGSMVKVMFARERDMMVDIDGENQSGGVYL